MDVDQTLFCALAIITCRFTLIDNLLQILIIYDIKQKIKVIFSLGLKNRHNGEEGGGTSTGEFTSDPHRDDNNQSGLFRWGTPT